VIRFHGSFSRYTGSRTTGLGIN